MKTGKVKFYLKNKGYGFIQDDETGKDIFVHATGTKELIYNDCHVEFDIRPDKKGRGEEAFNVSII